MSMATKFAKVVTYRECLLHENPHDLRVTWLVR